MKTITSRRHPLVARCRAVRRERRDTRQHLLLDGLRLVADAHASRVPLEIVVFSTSALQAGRPDVLQLRHALDVSRTPIACASDSVFDAISPVKSPSGIVALAAHRAVPASHVLEGAQRSRRTGLTIATIGVQDPGNVGAIIRTADAADAGGVLVAGSSADPFGWRALRGAMGSTFRIPVATIADADAVLDAARAAGARTVALSPRRGMPIYDADLDGPVVALVGGEASGLDPTVAVDATITIPMRDAVESLNVAVAAAILTYEAFRRARPPAGTHRARRNARIHT